MTHPLVTDFGAPACVRSNNDSDDGCNGDHLKTGFIPNSACESDGFAHSGQSEGKKSIFGLNRFFSMREMVDKNYRNPVDWSASNAWRRRIAAAIQ